MVGSIHEHKGKQELFLEANIDELKTLLEVALIQSTGAYQLMFHLVIPKAKKEPKSIYVLYFLCFFQEKGLIVRQKENGSDIAWG